jgi:hypothetical protein
VTARSMKVDFKLSGDELCDAYPESTPSDAILFDSLRADDEAGDIFPTIRAVTASTRPKCSVSTAAIVDCKGDPYRMMELLYVYMSQFRNETVSLFKSLRRRVRSEEGT